MNALFEKPSHTVGQFISAVLAITNEAAAAEFACDYVKWLSLRGDLKSPADEIMRSNIGYCFGEGMAEDKILMWRKVCGASHPWFGKVMPTPEECLVLGRKLAEK